MMNDDIGFDAEISNRKLRKLLDAVGLNDIHLIVGDDYLRVVADTEPHHTWLNALDSTTIHLNSFRQQTPDEWLQDIVSMIHRGRKEYMETHQDEIDQPHGESVNEDFAIGVTSVGLNQGIPHGGDGKGVNPVIMGQPETKKKKKKTKKLFKEYLSKYNV